MLQINSAYRTVAQQYLLNPQKDAGRCGITATAPPGFSNHEGGLALDIEDADGWKPYFERHNWIWIGDFDPVHFDYKFFAATRSDLGTIGARVQGAFLPNGADSRREYFALARQIFDYCTSVRLKYRTKIKYRKVKMPKTIT